MARLPRFVLPGHPQHVNHRGNNRHVTFADEADYYLRATVDIRQNKKEKQGSDPSFP